MVILFWTLISGLALSLAAFAYADWRWRRVGLTPKRPTVRCQVMGHKPALAPARGRRFIRDGVEYEAKPTSPQRIMCQRCGETLEEVGGIVMVFRDCKECGQSVACLAVSDKRPESCKEHQS